ncbi:hypothetical protein, partial [Acinetobacter baumannii]
MFPPVPKTKSSEVTDIINSAVPTGSISEFQYFRCKRLLNDIKETEPLDWFLLSNSIIEMYFDNPVLAHQYAREVLKISNSVSILSNLYFVFLSSVDFSSANENIDKIISLCSKQNLPLESFIPIDFKPITYFLDGILNDDLNYYKRFKKEDFNEFIQFFEIKNKLEIDSRVLKHIGSILFKCFNSRNVRCRKYEYSFIDDEFLILLYVDRSFDEIDAMNSEIFSKCYDEG